MFVMMGASLGNSYSARGADFVALVAFFPVIIPGGIVLKFVNFDRSFIGLLPVAPDWLILWSESFLISSVGCILLVLTGKGIFKKNNSSNENVADS